MKNKLCLFLSFAALSLTACSGTNSEEDSSNKYSKILKECATQIMQKSNGDTPQASAVKKAFTPTEAPGQALAFPAVYLYWAGLLNEIDGVNVVGEAICSSGTYRFNGMGQTQSITFDLSVDFDEENNKFTFLGRQDLPGTERHSYLVLTCDYDFSTSTLGGFSVIMQQDDNSYGNYMRYYNNVFESYSYVSSDSHETDPAYIEYHPIAERGINLLNTRMASENILEGEKLQASRLAFVSASDYCDEITSGVDFDAEIVDA